MDFSKIKKDAHVAIFGILDEALNIKQKIEKSRDDVKIVCFLDSFKTGELEGLPICSPYDIGKGITPLCASVAGGGFCSNNLKFFKPV